MSFILKDILNENDYNNLVTYFKNYQYFYYNESVFYNESDIVNNNKSVAFTNKYYNEFIPYIYKNKINDYIIIDTNINIIIDSLKNVIQSYTDILTYDNNPYLQTITFDGDVSDYELVISDSLIKVTNYKSNDGFLMPFKYECIIKELDPTTSDTNITLYSLLDSFNFKKNNYFLTTYSLFNTYILSKVSKENKQEIQRITDTFTNLTNSLIDNINANDVGIYIKGTVDNNIFTYISTEIIQIDDIVKDKANFPINIDTTYGFIQDNTYYIKFDKFDINSLTINDIINKDFLIFQDNNWISTPVSFTIPLQNKQDVIISNVNNDTFTSNIDLTENQYISDNTNSYKILSSMPDTIGYKIIYDKTYISDNISIGDGFSFTPILQHNDVDTINNNKYKIVKDIVNNLQTFIYDFDLSGVDIMDLYYYSISISDIGIEYKIIHDALNKYITLEQHSITGC